MRHNPKGEGKAKEHRKARTSSHMQPLYAAVTELRKLLLLLLTPLALPGFGDELKSLMGTLCHPVTSGIGGNSAGPG